MKQQSISASKVILIAIAAALVAIWLSRPIALTTSGLPPIAGDGRAAAPSGRPVDSHYYDYCRFQISGMEQICREHGH
jgi:hypothetical protein